MEILTIGNLILSLASGLIAGGYLTVFHPTNPEGGLWRRSVLQAWYFGFLGSIWYIARIMFAVVGEQRDAGRVVGGWLLWLLFSVALGGGAYIVGAIRQRREGYNDLSRDRREQ